jgi:hypothetical protein
MESLSADPSGPSLRFYPSLSPALPTPGWDTTTARRVPQQLKCRDRYRVSVRDAVRNRVRDIVKVLFTNIEYHCQKKSPSATKKILELELDNTARKTNIKFFT